MDQWPLNSQNTNHRVMGSNLGQLYSGENKPLTLFGNIKGFNEWMWAWRKSGMKGYVRDSPLDQPLTASSGFSGNPRSRSLGLLAAKLLSSLTYWVPLMLYSGDNKRTVCSSCPRNQVSTQVEWVPMSAPPVRKSRGLQWGHAAESVSVSEGFLEHWQFGDTRPGEQVTN